VSDEFDWWQSDRNKKHTPRATRNFKSAEESGLDGNYSKQADYLPRRGEYGEGGRPRADGGMLERDFAGFLS